jgi:hypothetical protein
MITWTVTCEPVGGSTIKTEQSTNAESNSFDDSLFAGIKGAGAAGNTYGKTLSESPLSTVDNATGSATSSSEVFFYDSNGAPQLEDSGQSSETTYQNYTISWNGAGTADLGGDGFESNIFKIHSSFVSSSTRHTTTVQSVSTTSYVTTTVAATVVTGTVNSDSKLTTSTAMSQDTTMATEQAQVAQTVVTQETYNETLYSDDGSSIYFPAHATATAFIIQNEVVYAATTVVGAMIQRESFCSMESGVEFTIFPSVQTEIGEVYDVSFVSSVSVESESENIATSQMSQKTSAIANVAASVIPQQTSSENVAKISTVETGSVKETQNFTGPTKTLFATIVHTANRVYNEDSWQELVSSTTQSTIVVDFATSFFSSTETQSPIVGEGDPEEFYTYGESGGGQSGETQVQWTRATPIRHQFIAPLNQRRATYQYYSRAYALAEATTAGMMLRAGNLTITVPTWQHVFKTANAYVGSFTSSDSSNTATISADAVGITRTVANTSSTTVETFAYSTEGEAVTVPQTYAAINPASAAAVQLPVVADLLPGLWFSTNEEFSTGVATITNADFYQPIARIAYSGVPLAVPDAGGAAYFTTARNNPALPT